MKNQTPEIEDAATTSNSPPRPEPLWRAPRQMLHPLLKAVSGAKRRWLIAIAALALLGWLSFRGRSAPVTYATAQRGALALTIAASGQVDGDAGDLAFAGAGKITAQYVNEGDTIAAQQLLARIQPSNLSGSEDVIQAPYAGYVVAIYRKLGEVVGPGTPVLRVARRGEIYVTAYLDSEDAAWLKPGDRFEARGGGYLARAWRLRVVNVGREAVPREDVQGSARQVRVRLAVLDNDFALPLGTAVDVDGEVELGRGLLQVPASAIVRQNGQTFVWRVTDQHVQQTAVRLGPNNFRAVAVTAGLAPGDAVVIEGKSGLVPGQRVEATRWEEPRP